MVTQFAGKGHNEATVVIDCCSVRLASMRPGAVLPGFLRGMSCRGRATLTKVVLGCKLEKVALDFKLA